MNALGIGEGTMVTIDNVRLPKASFAKFKPLSREFYDLADPKATLEVLLRSYSCLTKGQSVRFFYNSKHIDMEVVDLKPVVSSA